MLLGFEVHVFEVEKCSTYFASAHCKEDSPSARHATGLWLQGFIVLLHQLSQVSCALWLAQQHWLVLLHAGPDALPLPPERLVYSSNSSSSISSSSSSVVSALFVVLCVAAVAVRSISSDSNWQRLYTWQLLRKAITTV
jgi:hypothetical protein